MLGVRPSVASWACLKVSHSLSIVDMSVLRPREHEPSRLREA
jgi:hypothetical protein